jgi:hypothetical protein
MPKQTEGVMLKFVRLMLLRPVERFLSQWISISTTPATLGCNDLSQLDARTGIDMRQPSE